MTPKRTKISLVLIGQFNPDNFMPEKLAEGKAIAKNEAAKAKLITLVPKQSVQYTLSWVEITATSNRLQFSSLEAPYIRVCDLAIKTLRDLYPESSVIEFGINVDCDFDFISAEARNNFGIKIAPPNPWGAWGSELLKSMSDERVGTELQGGVLNQQMRLPFSSDGVYGWRDVVVGPSLEIPNQLGVLMRSNHHHQVKELNPDSDGFNTALSRDESTDRLLTHLAATFDDSVDQALTIFSEVCE